VNQKLVSIIIVNWNGLRWLADCFRSLSKQDWKNYEIVFVDNASKDGSVSWVKTHYPKTKVIINKKNLGFSDANNVGYRVAKGDYILFLNNDTRVTKAFITELVKVFENDSFIGGAQSKILLMDHPDTHDSVGAFLTPNGFLYHYGFGAKVNKKFDKQIDLYTVKGACMMFRSSVLKKIEVNGDILDPSYFAYFEETDMCHRVWLAGYRVVYAYRSVIYHKMGATSTSMNNAFIQYHSFKNRINTYLKNLDIKTIWKIMPIHITLCLAFVMYLLFLGRMQLAFAIVRAITWNIVHFQHTMRDRKYIQTQIRVNLRSDWIRNVTWHPPLEYYFNLLH